MRPAQRFLYDGIDQVEFLQSPGCYAQGFRRIFSLARVLPEYGGATLGRYHRVGTVLEHVQPVAHADCQGAPRTSLADDDGDDRCTQLRHDHQVPGNGLALPALFGADARVSARRIDKGQHRQFEPLRKLHDAQGLAITFRFGHAVIPVDAVLDVPALLVSYQRHRFALEPGNAGHNRGVVGKITVAVQLDKIGKYPAHVVQGIGPEGMPGYLGDLPGVECRKNCLGQVLAAFLQAGDLIVDIKFPAVTDMAQLLDLRLEFGYGLLEIKEID